MKSIVIKDIPNDWVDTDIEIKKGYILELDYFEGSNAWMYNGEWVCDPDSETANSYLTIIEEE